ncbi:MAG: hypothetical protein GWP06_04405, partial [Actinobacteria bacterium]|nr:hypothetical protein [Actinomycetota bacterium]
MGKKIVLCSVLMFFLFAGTVIVADTNISAQSQVKQRALKQHLLRAYSPVEYFSADEQDNYDVKAYSLRLKIDPADKIIFGEMDILAGSTIQDVDKIIINLDASFSIDSVRNDASGFVRKGDKTVITLQKPMKRDELFSVKIFYSGNPLDAINEGEAGMVIGKHGDAYAVYTDNAPWFARNWFPCKDVPWDKADSSDMIITVPNGLMVASNGLLRSQTDNGDGTTTFHWHESYPIATYLMSLAITDYKVFTDTYISASGDSMMLQHFVFPEDLQDAKIDFSRTPQMIGYFASLFGEYPFIREKYGMAEYNGIYAGMENQTITHIDPGYIRGNHSSDDLIAHELSHQWWGDCVTMGDWPHTWLNEGFATYCEALWEEHVGGEQAYHEYMATILRSAKNFKEPVYRYNNKDVYNLIVYDKGAAVMHMLRHVMGDEKFFKVFPAYLERFKYSNALTKDFQAVCEEIYGGDLGWFFDEWIMGTSFPKYAVSWRKGPISGDPGMGISGFISQVQDEDRIYTMPVDLTFYTGNTDTTITAFVDRQGAPFEFLWKVPLEIPIDSVIIDKDNWLLHGLGEMKPYRDIIIDHHYFREKEGNGNGVLEPEESAELVVYLQNLGDSLSNVTATLSTDDENIIIVNNVSHFGNMGIEQHVPVAAWGDLFKIRITSSDTSMLTAFYLDISGDEGFSKRDSFFVRIGFPQYLWVNAPGNAEFQKVYEQAMRAGRFNLDFISGERVAENPDTLKNYRAVVWCTDDRRFDPLPQQEQSAIGAFLDAGGKLLLSGENLLFGLLYSGRHSDSVFVKKYLHAD